MASGATAVLTVLSAEASAQRRAGPAVPSGLLEAALGFVAVTAAAFSHGAYYPTAWGLFAVAGVWVIAVRLVLGNARLGGLEVATLALLLALAAWVAASSLWGIPERGILETERILLYVTDARSGVPRSHPQHAALISHRRLGRSLRRVRLRGAHSTLSRTPRPVRSASPDIVSPSHWGTGTASACLRPWAHCWPSAWLHDHPAPPCARSPQRRCRCSSRRSTSRSAGVRGSRSRLDCSRAIALDPRRLQLVTHVLVLAPAVVVTLVVAYRSPALNRIDASSADATSRGASAGARRSRSRRLSALVALVVAEAGAARSVLDHDFAGRTRQRSSPAASPHCSSSSRSSEARRRSFRGRTTPSPRRRQRHSGSASTSGCSTSPGTTGCCNGESPGTRTSASRSSGRAPELSSSPGTSSGRHRSRLRDAHSLYLEMPRRTGAGRSRAPPHRARHPRSLQRSAPAGCPSCRRRSARTRRSSSMRASTGTGNCRP